MNAVEKVKNICKERRIPISKLESELHFSNGYIGQLKKGTFPADRARRIAEYLEIPIEYLLEGEDTASGIITCPDCGFTYDTTIDWNVTEHAKEHKAWEKASNKFGNLYCNRVINEKIKAINRNISRDLSRTLDERYNAQIEVLRCLFSRSIQKNDYNLQHVPFEKYVAMMMNNSKYCNLYDEELCKKNKRQLWYYAWY